MWEPPIVRTVAIHGDGIDEVVDAIERCSQFLRNSRKLALRAEEAEQQKS